MRDCCKTCRHRLELVRYDYSKGGCEHTSLDGFACTALAYEGTVVWMVELEEDQKCEAYEPEDGE